MNNLNQAIINRLTDLLNQYPNMHFGQALHELNIVRPIMAGDMLVGCHPLIDEHSLETFSRMRN